MQPSSGVNALPYIYLSRTSKNLSYPFAHIAPRLLSSQNNLAMLLRRQTDGKPTRKRPIRFLPTFGTKCQIILYRFLEGRTQLLYGFPLKRDDISNVYNFPMKYVRLIIKLNMRKIPFVFHHNFTPASIRKRRMETTAPLSVSFCG